MGQGGDSGKQAESPLPQVALGLLTRALMRFHLSRELCGSKRFPAQRPPEVSPWGGCLRAWTLGEGLFAEALAEQVPLGEGLQGVCSVPCPRAGSPSPSAVCPWMPSPSLYPCRGPSQGCPFLARPWPGGPSWAQLAAQPTAAKLGRVPACRP